MTDFSAQRIGVVGLGLIGGSFCKTIKKQLGVECVGLDANPDAVCKAVNTGAISRGITVDELSECDITDH